MKRYFTCAMAALLVAGTVQGAEFLLGDEGRRPDTLYALGVLDDVDLGFLFDCSSSESSSDGSDDCSGLLVPIEKFIFTWCGGLIRAIGPIASVQHSPQSLSSMLSVLRGIKRQYDGVIARTDEIKADVVPLLMSIYSMVDAIILHLGSYERHFSPLYESCDRVLQADIDNVKDVVRLLKPELSALAKRLTPVDIPPVEGVDVVEVGPVEAIST